MGNAFVAVADSRDALHYNPAGLNLMGRGGGRSWPERVDARATLIGLHAPWSSARHGWGYFPESSVSHPDFMPPYDDSTDLTPSSYPTNVDEITAINAFEFAMHNFGAAWWGEASVENAATAGVFLPQFTRTVRRHAVLQAAIAGAFGDRLSWGLGSRLVIRRAQTDVFYAGDSSFGNDVNVSRADIRSRAQRETWSGMTSVLSSRPGYGFDFGLLWRQTDWLRFGAAAQNVGLVLDGERMTPELTVGAAATVPVRGAYGTRGRSLVFAADYEDALNQHLETFAKFNFGAGVDQRLTNGFTIGAGAGFKGGYWSLGARLAMLQTIHFELLSWAEEGGDHLGDHELRRYMMNLSIGL